ncbi:MAG: copper resistance protein B [Sphingomonas sp.]|nr:copper resistance protein B [Sphingomonas sp.]
MRRLLPLLLAAAATPALAQGHGQHHGHHPAPPPPAAPDPHAGHRAEPPETPPDPHAGHDMPPPAHDPHAGHRMEPSGTTQDPHAGHDMPTPTTAPPVAPPPPGALGGPTHAADTVFDPARMAGVRAAVAAEHGGMRTSRFLIDRLEASVRRGRDGYGWEGVEFWYGTPTDRFVLASRGEGTFGDGVEEIEAQALWSHAIDPWFDLRLGVRADFRRGADRAWAVLGINGLAPYWFEVAAAAFISEKGEFTARFEAEYDLRLTQRLILQPTAEIELSAQDVPELGLGSGLAKAEAGLRLRYEFVPEFAPYVGVEYERAFGGTADYRRLAGERAGGWNLLVGVRAWF